MLNRPSVASFKKGVSKGQDIRMWRFSYQSPPDCIRKGNTGIIKAKLVLQWANISTTAGTEEILYIKGAPLSVSWP